MPRALIILTGSELTRGETRDLNGSFLATGLHRLGIEVEEIRLVPDDAELLERALSGGLERFDLTLVSGGLGPTADDLTIEVLARVTGRQVVQDPTARARMREIALARLGDESRIPDNFYRQAEVIEDSLVLANPVGLAPGCLVEGAGGILITLPGVPRELRGMFEETVVPELARRFEITPPRVYRAKIFNVPESVAETRIQALGIDEPGVEYGISARPGELTVRLIARARADHSRIDGLALRLEEEFGEDFIALPEGLVDATGERIEVSAVHVVHRLLLARRITVATAESCTGGGIGRKLTELAGSSSYFQGSIVAYQDELKQQLLAVSEADLREHGAVSEPVCAAMARGAREALGADLALSTTGIAGPGGGSREKPVGLVFTGLAGPGGLLRVVRREFPGTRSEVRRRTEDAALDLLRRVLQESPPIEAAPGSGS